MAAARYAGTHAPCDSLSLWIDSHSPGSPVPPKFAVGVVVYVGSGASRDYRNLPGLSGVCRNDTLDVLWRLGEGRRLGGCGMPTVAVEGQFRYVVNTRENAFEPPHVHV